MSTIPTVDALGRKEISVPQSLLNRVVITAVTGATVEWYDFFVYGLLATIVGKHFFPPGDPVAQTLAALLTFAVGLFFRPFGAGFFGILGDKLGRKPTFMISILLMGLSTFSIGLLPTYSSIGIWATVLVVLLRICQGLSVGGAWGGAVTYVAEYVPQNKRGYYGSFIPLAAPLAVVVANGVFIVVSLSLGPKGLEQWGWRIPFLLSLVLVGVALYLRWKLMETPVFDEMKKGGTVAKAPFKEAVVDYWKPLLMGCIITIGAGVGWYSAYFGIATTLRMVGKLDFLTVSVVMMISALISCVGYIILGGLLADRWGRKPVLLLGYALAAVTWYPLTTLLKTGNLLLIALVPIMLTTYSAMYYGPYGALFPELYPAKVRYTALSLAYHVPIGIFGGLAPYAMTYFVTKTNNPIAGVWYPIIATGLSCLVAAIYLRETREVDIYK